MTFINVPTTLTCPPEGSPKSKIAIIGDGPGKDEIRSGRPFTGPAGSILEQCLHSSGLIRSSCYLTNAIKEVIPYQGAGAFFNEKTGTFSDRGQIHIEQLRNDSVKTQRDKKTTENPVSLL